MQVLAARPELVRRTERLAPSALAERLAAEQPPLVLDVRGPNEWASGAIAGAVNHDVAHLGASLDELPRERPLVVYCSSGYRSAIAASLLEGAGFQHVSDLAGGLAAWDAAGLERDGA
jgi:rhodanese-related sulfurtransferase